MSSELDEKMRVATIKNNGEGKLHSTLPKTRIGEDGIQAYLCEFNESAHHIYE